MRARSRWLSVALAASIAACAGGARSDASAAESSSRVLVRFKSSDGFTYLDSLVLRNDRTAALAYDRRISGEDGSRRFRLAAATFDRVRRSLRAAAFASLRISYPSPGADLPSYSITYRGRTVTTDEGAIERKMVPRRLTQLIRVLEGIVTSRVPPR